jgi:serine/threonine protein kinase
MVWLTARILADVLGFMHSRNIIHMDIRPANMFIRPGTGPVDVILKIQYIVDKHYSNLNNKNKYRRHSREPTCPYPAEILIAIRDGLTDGSLVLCVGDFGMVCKSEETTLAQEGDEAYCAGELINGDRTSGVFDLEKCDVFSSGATLYELCKGTKLLTGGSGSSSEWHDIRDGRLSATVLDSVSPSICRLLRATMHPDPVQRPSAIDIGQGFLKSLPELPSAAAAAGVPAHILAALQAANAENEQLRKQLDIRR